MLSWRARRQITYFIIFAAIVGLLGWLIFSWIVPAPTCFDNKQNQKEEGVDCGGPCSKKCVGEVRSLNILWARAVRIGANKYDAAALVENPNFTAGARRLAYKFKFYDERNVTIGIREGETFVNPSERFVVFEPNVDVGHSIPARVTLEWVNVDKAEWVNIGKDKPALLVTRKTFNNDPVPVLEAQVRNDAPTAVSNIYVSAVLYDADQNVFAVSQSLLDSLDSSAIRSVFFTWPQPFMQSPASLEIFIRTDRTAL